MFSKSVSILTWLINIFNPPPLEAMTKWQKVSRALLVTLTLVVGCVLCAMLGALGIFLVERGRHMFTNSSELFEDLGIVLISVGVNVLCVWVLLQIKRADSTMMLTEPETAAKS